MNTPPRQVAHATNAARKYTAKEKQQLIDNLDIEIADRTRRFRDTLNDVLTRFKNHQEALILRLPKSVRSITMEEFGDKYDGDVEACLRGLHKKNQGDEPENITAAVRKRKWQESQDESTPARAHKTARNGTPSPTKAKTPSRFPKTPGRQFLHDIGKRLIPSSPRHQLTRFPSLNRKSPQKAIHPLSNPIRPPSSAFDPNLPKTPAYPRAAKRNEPLMSVNGSPLENPLHGTEEGALPQVRPGHTVRKRASSILVKRTAPPTTTHPPVDIGSKAKASPAVHTQGFISVTTKDGHVLEFDPFTTDPAEIDALEGVSESAKQAAKDSVARFISSQMAKWTIS